ncbi:M16 family metallopeptidase [Mucilaginibacter kameinonensis]|uniref:M16 family metallopeptidase n=1 Tax=Mucilaginibacter kameinonensis TaxID=452286 RepID=UPI000EF7C134|nr:insulinase family protein [Mucilaginibacter kameinonensis]
MKISNIFAWLYLAGACGIAHAQDLPLDPAVRTGRLPNGFTYYIRHNENPGKRVIFYLANKVGSILETEEQRGFAHFTEHMSFNGTVHYPKNELVNYLQKSGVRFGADLNAYTSFDETVYQLPLPADDPVVVGRGLQIMRDWAQGATLDPAEIDKERGVVLEEKRLGKGADERMRAYYFPLLTNGSRYAQRLPIGTDGILNTFKPEALRDFYNEWYRPDLQAIIIVGDINVDAMENAVKVRFSDLKNPVKEQSRTKYAVKLTGKNQFIVATDPEQTSTTVEVIHKQIGLQLHTASQYRESLVRELFNTMVRDRFSGLERQANPPFLRGSAGIEPFLGGLDCYTVSVTAKPGELETGFKAAWKEQARVMRSGFTQAELDRAKNNFMSRMASALKEKDKTPSESLVKEYLQYFLSGTAAPGIAAEYELLQKELPGIKLADLYAMAGMEAKGSDTDVLITAPAKDKALVPAQAVFKKWVREAESEIMPAYQETVSADQLLSALPAAGKIVKEEKDLKLHITRLTLSNGVKVILKPTSFKNDQILFSGFSDGGTSLYSDAEYQSAAASNLIPSFGAGNFNTLELNRYLTGKQINVRPFINERTQGVSGGSSVADFESALRLILAYFTAPRKDSLQFQGIIARSKAALVNRGEDPSKVYADTVNAILGSNNPRRTGPSQKKLDQISLDRAFAIYRERFADASGFTFVITGSIDTGSVRPMLARYLGALPSNGRIEQARDLHITTPPGKITATVYKGTEERATVNLVFSGDFNYDMENNLKLDALKEVIAIRLNERLREEESGVYSPGVKVASVKYPAPRFNLNISFGCAPQNVEKLISSTLDEIDKIRKSGPAQINLDKFKAEDHRTIETQVQTNGFWVGYLSAQIQNAAPLDEITLYQHIIAGMTTGDIKTMAQKYLNGDNYIRLVLMPEQPGM